MASIYTIPTAFDGTAAYEQRTELDGREYLLRFLWNERDAGWYLSILDQDEAVLAAGLRIVVDFPLLRRETDPRLPQGVLIAIDESDTGIDPGLYDLGQRVKLTYVTGDES